MVTLHYLKVTPTITIKLLREKPDAHPAYKAQLFSKPLLSLSLLIFGGHKIFMITMYKLYECHEHEALAPKTLKTDNEIIILQ